MKDLIFTLKFIGFIFLIAMGIGFLVAGFGWFILGWQSGVQFSNAFFMIGALFVYWH